MNADASGHVGSGAQGDHLVGHVVATVLLLLILATSAGWLLLA